MIALDFDANRAAIAAEFKAPCWNPESGMAPEALAAAVQAIAAEKGGRPLPLVKADMIACVLNNAQLAVPPHEYFADQFRHGGLIPAVESGWCREAKAEAADAFDPKDGIAAGCRAFTGYEDFGHTCPDWEALLSLGYPGILRRIKAAYRDGLSGSQRVFLDACVTALEALLRFVGRLAGEAERQQRGNPKMALVARSLRALTEGPPETLHEALQLSMITYWVQTAADNVPVRSLGAFDRLYGPFYEADIASGRYTKAELAEILRYYFCRIDAADITANMPFSLCGMNRDGSDASSEFTHVVLDVYGELRLISPKIHIRVHPGTPEPILGKVFSLIRAGVSSFVFCNDEAVIASMVKLGETQADARDYIMVGCYESTSMGREVACTCNGRVSFPKAVEYALTGGIDMLTGAPAGLAAGTEFADFEAFLDAVDAQLCDLATRCAGRITAIERLYPRMHASPLFSATMQSCLDSALDAHEGGATYNFSSINAFGLATAADALAAIRQLVFEEGRYTLAELTEILKNDWAGHEVLRLSCKRRCPKYGNNDDGVDALAARLVRTAAGAINGRPNGRGGAFRMGAFSIDWRFDFGAHTAASADGRRAGEPLSKNIGASMGMDREGITAQALSAGKIDYTDLANGTVLDLVWHETAVRGDAGLHAMLSVLYTFFARGAMALQCNVLSAETLRRAQREPEQYATLQVRLCGWNVLFVNLTRAEQDEFILQCEAAG